MHTFRDEAFSNIKICQARPSAIHGPETLAKKAWMKSMESGSVTLSAAERLWLGHRTRPRGRPLRNRLYQKSSQILCPLECNIMTMYILRWLCVQAGVCRVLVLLDLSKTMPAATRTSLLHRLRSEAGEVPQSLLSPSPSLSSISSEVVGTRSGWGLLSTQTLLIYLK